jgi:hypothetical protein
MIFYFHITGMDTCKKAGGFKSYYSFEFQLLSSVLLPVSNEINMTSG